MAARRKPRTQPRPLAKSRYNKRSSSRTKKNKSRKISKKMLVLILIWITPIGVSGYLLYKNYDPDIVSLNNLSEEEKARIIDRVRQETINTDYNTQNPVINVSRETEVPAEQNPPQAVSDGTYGIYFVKTNDSSSQYELTKVIRNFGSRDNIIADLVNEIISGPKASEENQSLITAVPQGCRLIDYGLTQGIAVLNFNEEFRYTLGYDAMELQIAQIVLTLTELPDVQSVIFNINGQQPEYLDTHGYMQNLNFKKSDVPMVLAY